MDEFFAGLGSILERKKYNTPLIDKEILLKELDNAFIAIEKISSDPDNLDLRRNAEVVCFYAVQRLQHLLSVKNHGQ